MKKCYEQLSDDPIFKNRCDKNITCYLGLCTCPKRLAREFAWHKVFFLSHKKNEFQPFLKYGDPLKKEEIKRELDEIKEDLDYYLSQI